MLAATSASPCYGAASAFFFLTSHHLGNQTQDLKSIHTPPRHRLTKLGSPPQFADGKEWPAKVPSLASEAAIVMVMLREGGQEGAKGEGRGGKGK